MYALTSLRNKKLQVEQAGVLVVTRHDRSQDKLEIVLEGGRIKISIYIGLAEKTFYAGQR